MDEETLAKLEGTKLGEMKKHLDESIEDYIKARGGESKAASRRVRKHMLGIKELALSIRKEMLETRK
jgi:hypothetical protein